MEESHSDESSETQEAMDIDTASSASEENKNQEQKSYTCDTCEKIFYDRSVFKSHNCSEKEKNRDKPTTSSAGTSNLAEQQKTTSASEQVESQPQDLASNDASITSQARDNSSSRENFGETTSKKFICSCGDSFKSKSDLNGHQKKCSNKEYKCDKCPKSFQYWSLLKRHKRVHTGERPYECKTCEKAFSQKSHLESHVKICTKKMPPTSKQPEEGVSPDEPTTSSAGMSNLAEQRETTSASEQVESGQNLASNDAPTTSQAPDNSSSRENSGETKNKPFWCLACEKEFQFLSEFNTHKKLNPKKENKCNNCLKTFSKECYLNIHIKRKECLKPHDESTTSQARDNSSSRENSGETTSNDFCCACGHSFKYKCDFLKHRRNCSNKGYKCDKCHKTFSKSSILKRHKTTHTGEKPYKCKLCGKAFPQKSDLEWHVKTCKKKMPPTSKQPEEGVSPDEPTTSSAGMSNLAEQRETTSASEQVAERHVDENVDTSEVFAEPERDLECKLETCTVCQKQFSNEEKLLSHLAIHLAEALICPSCQKAFSNKEELDNHSKTKHF